MFEELRLFVKENYREMSYTWKVNAESDEDEGFLRDRIFREI